MESIPQHYQPAWRSVTALWRSIKPRKGAGAPRHHPDVSLRGAKRRGNLAVPGRITGKPSAKSQLPPRDCTPRALPRAARSGRHVGLRPPRNDKSGGYYRFIVNLFGSAVQRRERHAAPLHWPLRAGEIAMGAKRPRNDKSGAFAILTAACTGCPSPTRCVRSARALGNSRVRMALTERRYRRNRCVPF